MNRSLQGLRVLIVEDDPHFSDILREWIVEDGAIVVDSVTNLYDAYLALSSGGAIDVVLLDLQLHGGTAFDLAAQLTEMDIPVIIMSGLSPETLDVRHAGMHFFRKPFDLNELSSVLMSVEKRPG